MRAKTLLSVLIIFWMLTSPCLIYSQDVIEQDGTRYVDTEYHNTVVAAHNEALELLEESKTHTEKVVVYTERVIEVDKEIEVTVEKVVDKGLWQGRKEGCILGSSTILLIIIITRFIPFIP